MSLNEKLLAPLFSANLCSGLHPTIITRDPCLSFYLARLNLEYKLPNPLRFPIIPTPSGLTMYCAVIVAILASASYFPTSLLKFTKFGGFFEGVQCEFKTNEETDSEVKTMEMEYGAGSAQASLSRHHTNHHFTSYTLYQMVSTCVDRDDRYT